jgi:hypothetical protein
MELDALTETIDHLVASDPSAYADGESVEALQRQLSRLEAFATAATGAFDVAEAWAPDGARGAAAWLATRCHLPKSHARRRVHLGRQLGHLPHCAQAWMAGDLTSAQVGAMAAVRRPVTEGALARDEGALVAQARTLRYEAFARVLTYWEQMADPDGTEGSAERQRARRDVFLESSFQGTWLGQITLDPVSGAIVSDELKRIRTNLGASPADLDESVQ